MASVLIIGSGGREHAIGWKIGQSEKVDSVYVAPGNGATAAGVGKYKSVKDCDLKDFDKLSAWCLEHRIDLVFVGNEEPLAEGIADCLLAKGIKVFGPSKTAALIESSKSFAKDFMIKYGIPTAQYKTFTSCEEAVIFIAKSDFPPLVVKASFLAAGKGVFVCENREEAMVSATELLEGHLVGSAGKEIVIEELLEGPEVSVLAFCDGKTVSVMPPAQDHKRRFEKDTGPNTGGMGAYCPYPLSPELIADIKENVVQKAIDGLAKESSPFIGVLYAGLMLTPSGYKVLEYNCRFGDPETQVILPKMDSDLFEVAMACAEGRLSEIEVKWNSDFLMGVCAVVKQYPGSYPKGAIIKGLESFSNGPSDDCLVFQAGVTFNFCKDYITNGGRVFCMVGRSRDFQTALAVALQGMSRVRFDGMAFRSDIGWRILSEKEKVTYANAGVCIAAGNELVEQIKGVCGSTWRAGCLENIGGFGSAFDLSDYKDPVLISGTDGVGTKIKVAELMNKFDTIGIDLVAMCVNDILCRGAEPLFFLDYFACGKLDVGKAKAVVEGVAAGCRTARCALVGGETAEMPDVYSQENIDVAGFAVGVVSKDSLLPNFDSIQENDVLIGLPSSGIHSNGYSLVRRIVARLPDKYNTVLKSDGRSLGEVLLEPTTIYIDSVLPLIQTGLVKSLAHITGGGLIENIPRCIPYSLSAHISVNWVVPPVFRWLMWETNLSTLELSRVFNIGIGMVLVASPENAKRICKTVLNSIVIGSLKKNADLIDKVYIDSYISPLSRNEFLSVALPKNKVKVGVLISGSGTNLQALIDYSKKPDSSYEIVVVISNVADVYGLKRASDAQIPSLVIDHKSFKSRLEFDMQVYASLEKYGVKFVCLAGFMRIVTSEFINKFPAAMLNTHPSLLPAFKGAHAHSDVLAAGVRVSGCSVHFVSPEVDSGAIVMQKSVPVFPQDTEGDLQERVKLAEHVVFPLAVEAVTSGQCVLREGRCVWSDVSKLESLSTL